ncbi:MAG TPA: thioredoxin family protein [Puia sp.]|jgi:thioredoxin-related protein|nr:thioredoxin family protein [Puia sp.]
MTKALIGLLFTALLATDGWHYNLDEARQLARDQHKHILLNFSGSDWCGPCIQLRKQILDNPDFLQMADTMLILVNADFPRSKKNQLSTQQQALNNAAADKYNPQGKFPYTLLLDADGKILKTWEGLPDEKPADFVMEVRNAIYTHP